MTLKMIARTPAELESTGEEAQGNKCAEDEGMVLEEESRRSRRRRDDCQLLICLAEQGFYQIAVCRCSYQLCRCLSLCLSLCRVCARDLSQFSVRLRAIVPILMARWSREGRVRVFKDRKSQGI